VALAVVARVAADLFARDPQSWLAFAAAVWSAAYLLIFAFFLMLSRRQATRT
jgi:hypothetical protein